MLSVLQPVKNTSENDDDGDDDEDDEDDDDGTARKVTRVTDEGELSCTSSDMWEGGRQVAAARVAVQR